MSYSFSKIGTRIFAAIVAFASLSAASLAQNGSTAVRVKIPFAFETSTKQLPAGVYTVQMEQQHVVAIHGTSASAFTIVQPDQNPNMLPTEHGKLIFHRQGDRYTLSQVWMPGQSTHSDLPRVKRAKTVERASNESTETDVEIAALEILR